MFGRERIHNIHIICFRGGTVNVTVLLLHSRQGEDEKDEKRSISTREGNEEMKHLTYLLTHPLPSQQNSTLGGSGNIRK